MHATTDARPVVDLLLAELEFLRWTLRAAPFDAECPVCTEPVLVVEVQGRDVVADAVEVLARFRCPDCSQVAQMGHRRSWCLRCDDTGYVGEALPAFGVALDELGGARWFNGDRGPGEAVHRLHVCSVGPR